MTDDPISLSPSGDPQALWLAIATELGTRTAHAYDNAILPARAVSFADDVLTIHSHTHEWLQNRLGDLITRVAGDVAGRPVRVVYVNGEIPAAEPAPRPATAAIVDLPPTYDPRKRLWAKHPLVVSRVYPAYFVRVAGRVIGSTCFPFWRHLCDRFDMSFSDNLDWTPPAPYILGRLAIALGCPVTHLAGRLRTCHHFDKALLDTGEVIPCCGHFRGARMGQTQQGRPACYYRIAGALEVLCGAGWLAARRLSGESRTFNIQVLRFPPLPTLAQIELLPAALQEEYYGFLRDCGHDQDEWRQGRLSQIGTAGLKLKLYTDTYSASGQSNGEDGFFLASNWSQWAE